MAQSAPAADAPVKVKAGQAIYSADGASLGRIDYVQADKSGAPQYVGVIYDMHVVHIPADSLSEGQKGLVTSLKRSEISKLK